MFLSHSSCAGVAEHVIGPATSGRTRWRAYDPRIHAKHRQLEEFSQGGDEEKPPVRIAGSGAFRDASVAGTLRPAMTTQTLSSA
jgi:hypothetical protein